MLGGVAGGFLARALSAFFPPVALIVAGSLTLILTGFIVARAHRRIRPEGMPVPGSGGDASQDGGSGTTGGVRNGSLLAMVLRQSDLLRQPYVQALLGISGLAAVAALYIDFQFYAAATLTGSNSAQFFANFYIILNGASLGLQILVAPRLQARFGVGGALMLLPTLLLGSAGVFSFGGTIQSRAILKVTEGGLKASIHRAMWEQAFLPIGRERRDVAKVLVDGLFARLSEGVAGVSLLLWLRQAYGTLTQSSLNWISWAIIGAVLLWVALTRYLRRIGCSDVSPDESAIRLPDG